PPAWAEPDRAGGGRCRPRHAVRRAGGPAQLIPPTRVPMTTLICDCNRTMPLAPDELGRALGETLAPHSLLCRGQAGDFQRAVRGAEPVVVACTQEKRLFGELGRATEGAVSPVRFVNIRETGCWSRAAARDMPKQAALLAGE